MDLALSVPQIPSPGETIQAIACEMIPGGKGANQAYACGRLGGSCVFLSAVGDRLEESDELRAERALADAGFDECEVNIFASASGAHSAERANVDVSNCPQKGEIDERYLIEIVKKCLGCKEVKIYGQRE